MAEFSKLPKISLKNSQFFSNFPPKNLLTCLFHFFPLSSGCLQQLEEDSGQQVGVCDDASR
jgi:hypothetical protein